MGHPADFTSFSFLYARRLYPRSSCRPLQTKVEKLTDRDIVPFTVNRLSQRGRKLITLCHFFDGSARLGRLNVAWKDFFHRSFVLCIVLAIKC